jgi:hypothetical protein
MNAICAEGNRGIPSKEEEEEVEKVVDPVVEWRRKLVGM